MQHQSRIAMRRLPNAVAAQLRAHETPRWVVRHINAAREPIPYKSRLLVALLRRRGFTATVLLYPAKPRAHHLIYKTLHVLGCRITADPGADISLAIHWESATFRDDESTLEEIAAGVPVLNRSCNDISKRTIGAAFTSIFGYGIEVDPTVYAGKAVKKSNVNARHDGEVVDCPLAEKDDSYVYQRLIDTEREAGLVEDIRLCVLGRSFPLCYLKQRRVDRRFSNTNASARLVSPDQVLSAGELDKIRVFAQRIGMDYGELDILRDKNDQRLYIVDANNTPAGPPNHICRSEYWTAIRLFSSCLSEFAGLSGPLDNRK